LRERAFFVLRGKLRGKIVAEPCGLPRWQGLRVGCASHHAAAIRSRVCRPPATFSYIEVGAFPWEMTGG
jgi:hypothetical protein